jgi:hypothetical protein
MASQGSQFLNVDGELRIVLEVGERSVDGEAR